MDNHYDIIIAGAGAAGLSLARRLLEPPFREKSILVVDTNLEPINHKTWCFWDDASPPFTDLIYKQWNNVETGISGGIQNHILHDHTYYCIRSIDFTQKILQELSDAEYIDLKETSIKKLDYQSGKAVMHTDNETFRADYIFQSCFQPPQIKKSPPQYPLLQHFHGWEIETAEPVFDESSFTLMDFDESFNDGVAFMYILPWSADSALLEYTIFSDEVLKPEVYEEKISLYLNHRFNITPIEYEIKRKEGGQIPMQDRPDPLWYQPNIMNIGIQGGVTKPSTGYTFRRIQKHSDAIIEALKRDQLPEMDHITKKRFKAYDLWLLQIMHDHPSEALETFNHLFTNNSMDEIFYFLSEETNIMQDLNIMGSVPPYPFLRAMWKTAPRLLEI